MTGTRLLASRRFLPLLLTQFLGALNDNFFKMAVVMLVTYRLSATFKAQPHMLVILAGAFYILPYILFCPIGGKLADRFDKATVARIIKLAEVVFMLLAALGFYFHLPALLFFVLFCMGAHSAFFSPAKYALMPEHLREDELMQGNAYIEAATFIATLLGTIAGGEIVLKPNGEFTVSVCVLFIAVLGVAFSRFIPPSAVRDASARVNLNPITETREMFRYLSLHPALFKTSLANSWFYFAAILFAMLLAPYAQVMGLDEDVGTLFMTCFTVGLGAGMVACGILMGGRISTSPVRWCALGMSLFICDFWVAGPVPPAQTSVALLTLHAFITVTPNACRMLFDLFMIAFCSGFYVVPLYAALQYRSPPEHRAQVMAGNNVMNGFFIVIAACTALVLFALGCGIADVFLSAGLLTLGVAAWLSSSYGRPVMLRSSKG